MVVGEAGVSPAQAGGTAQRAVAYAAKLDAAKARGVDGYLVWGWADPPSGWDGWDDFAVFADDPLLPVLANAAATWPGPPTKIWYVRNAIRSVFGLR